MNKWIDFAHRALVMYAVGQNMISWNDVKTIFELKDED